MKTKLTGVNKNSHDEHPRVRTPKDTDVPRFNEEYITQVSEDFERRQTKKISKEFRRTDNGILRALSNLVQFEVKSSGATGKRSETSRDATRKGPGFKRGPFPELFSS